MRYIVLNNNISDSEIISRLRFIKKITNLYFIPYKKNNYTEFVSIPADINDCLLIVGHNHNVELFLKKEKIPEKIIAIISCKVILPKTTRKNKEVYVTFKENGLTYYYDGKDWNLDFDVSENELKLINSSGDIYNRIKKYFRRII